MPKLTGWICILLLLLFLVLKSFAWYIDPPVESEDRQNDIIPERENPNNQAAIVFFHGIAGHFKGTWTNPNTKRSWPQMLTEDARFASFDLYSVAYDSHGPGPSMPDVLDRLEKVIPVALSRYQDIYIIAHSLGGIVTQKLLTRLRVSQDQPSGGFPDNIKLVVFLATPGKSSIMAWPMEILASNPLWGYLASKEFVSDTVDLWLRRRRRPEIDAACATERLPMKGLYRVVSEESAMRSCSNRVLPATLYGDHVMIAKPKSCADDSYTWVALQILFKAQDVRGWLFPHPPKECSAPAAQPVKELAMPSPMKLSLSRILRQIVPTAQAQPSSQRTDFDSLKLALHERKDPAHVPALLDYFKSGSGTVLKAANLVAELFKVRKDPSKNVDFYKSLARITQDASLSVKSPFGSIDFSGADLSDLDFGHVNFNDARFVGVSFLGANLENASFKRACLQNSKFFGKSAFAWMEGTNFAGADLTGADVVWEGKRSIRKIDAWVGLSRASSLESTILTAKDPSIPRDQAAARGVIFAELASWSPCRAVPGAPRAIDELQDIYFDFDKPNIPPDSLKILDNIIRWIKANPDYLILIEGHANEIGTNEYNFSLAAKRAQTVKDYLLSRGVPTSQVTLINSGNERRLCQEKTEECEKKSRRVTFSAVPRPAS